MMTPDHLIRGNASQDRRRIRLSRVIRKAVDILAQHFALTDDEARELLSKQAAMFRANEDRRFL